jgi:hypothetical protein
MANSIYQQLNNGNNFFQNQQNLISQFNTFRKNLQGDPQQIVQQLLQNGQMSQTQYSQLRQMAQQFQQLLYKNNL